MKKQAARRKKESEKKNSYSSEEETVKTKPSKVGKSKVNFSINTTDARHEVAMLKALIE